MKIDTKNEVCAPGTLKTKVDQRVVSAHSCSTEAGGTGRSWKVLGIQLSEPPDFFYQTTKPTKPQESLGQLNVDVTNFTAALLNLYAI